MHQFLTGPTGVGKSSIIKTVVKQFKLSTAGFITRRIYNHYGEIEGFLLEKALFSDSEEAGADAGMIAYCKGDNWEIDPRCFNQLGVRLLRESLQECSKGDIRGKCVLVMDELGFFENTAFEFQKEVLNCLDQEKIPVVGVIKEKQTPFLNIVRNHENVQVIPVSPASREKQVVILMERLKRYWTMEEDS